jgi:hypothetical protein
LIGQNWQRENGNWMHKWTDFRSDEVFEKHSWKNKAKGKDDDSWTYENVVG